MNLDELAGEFFSETGSPICGAAALKPRLCALPEHSTNCAEAPVPEDFLMWGRSPAEFYNSCNAGVTLLYMATAEKAVTAAFPECDVTYRNVLTFQVISTSVRPLCHNSLTIITTSIVIILIM